MSVEAQIHGFQNVLIFGTEDSWLVAIEKELLKHDSVFNTKKIEYIIGFFQMVNNFGIAQS